jgi:hypothetical protein
MLAKKTSKNQITLPKEIVKAFQDAEYFDVSIKDNAIRLMPVKITPIQSSLDSVREKIKKLGLTEKDVGEAIRWARGRKR